MQSLKKIWTELCHIYSDNTSLIAEYWNEISEAYTNSSRHYHSISHVDNMISLAFQYQHEIIDFDTLLFSIFYHDIVYDASKKDNEERSGDIAKERLIQLKVSDHSYELTYSQILATKSHITSANPDTNLLLDIDLSVLGADWDTYLNYANGVRKEYHIYPDLLYKPGRRKVLNHFLEMTNIYKTELLKNRFEANARVNLRKELELLS